MWPANSRKSGVDFGWPPVREVPPLFSADCVMSTSLLLAEESTRSHRIARALNTSAILKVSAPKDSESEKVMKSELCFAHFVAEHITLSIATADHFTKPCKVMFLDSHVAESFSCGRTKITALITHALAPSMEETVVTAFQKQPFSIYCDGGNDNFQKKYFGILV